MSGWRGMFAGALALIALQVIVSTSDAANRTSTGFKAIADVVQRALSPAVPLVPDRTGAGDAPAPPGPVTAPATYDPSKPQPAKAPPATLRA